MTDRPPVSGEPTYEDRSLCAECRHSEGNHREDHTACHGTYKSGKCGCPGWRSRLDRPPVSGEPRPECPSCDDSWAAHVAGLHEEGPGGLVLPAEANTGAALDVAPTIDEKRAVVNLLRESDYYPDQGSVPPAGNDGVVEDDWDRYQSRLGSVGFAIRRARLAEQEGEGE